MEIKIEVTHTFILDNCNTGVKFKITKNVKYLGSCL